MSFTSFDVRFTRSIETEVVVATHCAWPALPKARLGLIIDSAGVLFGTTYIGDNTEPPGSMFEIVP